MRYSTQGQIIDAVARRELTPEQGAEAIERLRYEQRERERPWWCPRVLWHWVMA